MKESMQLAAGAEGEQVRKNAFVWHFSGTVDTQPWLFLDKATVEELRTFAAKTWFTARDPSGVVAGAVAEWREALDDLLNSKPGDELNGLRRAVNILPSQSSMCRRRRFRCTPRWCDACGEERCNVEWVCEALSAALGEPFLVSACAECLVSRLQSEVSGPMSNGDVERHESIRSENS